MKEKILRVLEALESEKRVLSLEELGLEENEYCELFLTMLYGNLIFDANVKPLNGANTKYFRKLNDTKITIEGLDYLEANKEKINK